MTTASTALTKVERRAEQRRMTAQSRQIHKGEKGLRATYAGLDDLDVPSVREVVGRYQNLRDSGRLPADGDELEGAVWTVRRKHSQLSSEALLRGMFVGLLVMLAHAKFSSWAVDDELASVVFGALAVVVVWAIVRRSEQKRLVVFRAHADALLSRAEAVEVAVPS